MLHLVLPPNLLKSGSYLAPAPLKVYYGLHSPKRLSQKQRSTKLLSQLSLYRLCLDVVCFCTQLHNKHLSWYCSGVGRDQHMHMLLERPPPLLPISSRLPEALNHPATSYKTLGKNKSYDHITAGSSGEWVWGKEDKNEKKKKNRSTTVLNKWLFLQLPNSFSFNHLKHVLFFPSLCIPSVRVCCLGGLALCNTQGLAIKIKLRIRTRHFWNSYGATYLQTACTQALALIYSYFKNCSKRCPVDHSYSSKLSFED